MTIQHYQVIEDVIADGVDSQPDARQRWLKKISVGLSGLVLLSVVASSMSTPALSQPANQDTRSTSLLGLSPSLRSPLGGIAKSGSHMPRQGVATAPLREYGIGLSSPLEKLAITAVKATRVNAGQVELEEELSNMDDDTKATMSKVEEVVVQKVQDMSGVTAPFGFFDPLGFSTNIPEGRLLFFREVEVKHGRVAMLASLGILVAEHFHPLFGGNINVPSYIAFQETPLQTFWPAVLVAIAIPEIQQIKTFDSPFEGKVWSTRSDHVAGELGFDPLGLKPSDPKDFRAVQSKEINNGRLAMIAAAGMIAQEVATGQKIF